MKTSNYDWLFTGCHSVPRVASVFFPSSYSTSNARSLRRYIRRHPDFYAELLEAGYDERDMFLTPMQISIIVRYIGLPKVPPDKLTL